jgi:hypothetical protein
MRGVAQVSSVQWTWRVTGAVGSVAGDESRKQLQDEALLGVNTNYSSTCSNWFSLCFFLGLSLNSVFHMLFSSEVSY